ncbi:MAG: shikimate dehydrogenase [Actinomycetota bacterium]|nr:shikimate dehydrogenase [Actinomycetota bacterium]
MASLSRRAAVLGRPVVRSLSPVLHRAAYAALGLDWSYEAIDCGVAELSPVLGERQDWGGFSCTMPLKHAALALADERSPTAQAVGAANTLLPRAHGGWRAENTDVFGIAAALQERSVRPRSVTILGAGGTAQAAVLALAQSGLRRCSVLVRDVARAERLSAVASTAELDVDVGLLAPQAPELGADLIISTLPPGAADAVAGQVWSAGQALLDVVYDPWPTRIAASVRAAGGAVVSGALMLLHQAAAQVELMTGSAAPLEAMRAALLEASPDCGI